MELFKNKNEYYEALLRFSHPLHKQAMVIRDAKVALDNLRRTRGYSELDSQGDMVFVHTS